MLPYACEVTKYDPADRDDKGRRTGAQDQLSDHGPVEAAYLRAVADFAAETGVRQLAIREPQVAVLQGPMRLGVAETAESSCRSANKRGAVQGSF